MKPFQLEQLLKMMLLRNCIIRSTTSSVASLIVSWPGVLGKLSASRHL